MFLFTLGSKAQITSISYDTIIDGKRYTSNQDSLVIIEFQNGDFAKIKNVSIYIDSSITIKKMYNSEGILISHYYKEYHYDAPLFNGDRIKSEKITYQNGEVITKFVTDTTNSLIDYYIVDSLNYTKYSHTENDLDYLTENEYTKLYLDLSKFGSSKLMLTTNNGTIKSKDLSSGIFDVKPRKKGLILINVFQNYKEIGWIIFDVK